MVGSITWINTHVFSAQVPSNVECLRGCVFVCSFSCFFLNQSEKNNVHFLNENSVELVRIVLSWFFYFPYPVFLPIKTVFVATF